MADKEELVPHEVLPDDTDIPEDLPSSDPTDPPHPTQLFAKCSPRKDHTTSTSPATLNPTPQNKQQGAGNGVSPNQVHILASGPYPVLYYTNGSSSVGQATLHADGVIRTPNAADTPQTTTPLRLKDIKPLIGFSILSLIILPPTGLAALILAIKTRREFEKGVETGQLDKAQKTYRISEKLVIFSVLGGLLLWVIVLAVIEKGSVMGHEEYTYTGHI